MAKATHYHLLMTKKTFYNILLFVLLPFIGFSQEVLVELSGNPVITQAYRDAQSKPKSAALGDTLSLPFFEEFAELIPFPNPSLWLDSFAYINQTYAKFPPSIGMATLDGLNKDGMPYEFSFVQTYGLADKLTSKYIDLSGNVPGDSIYFSFYYQPQGLGNAPESEDSLVLQFKYADSDTTYDWRSVWRKSGSSIQTDSLFDQVMIPVTDTAFFKSGFQFRFINYSTLSGNVDHWHIDYIKMAVNRFAADTVHTDMAITQPLRSVLKHYQAMPWSHYINDTTDVTADSIIFKIHNFYDDAIPTAFTGDIFDPNNTPIKNFSAVVTVPVDPFVYCGNADDDVCTTDGAVFLNGLNFSFPVNFAGDEVEFTVKAYLEDLNQNTVITNDTIAYKQKFHNYYAYDDGSAESAYGLLFEQGAMAYRFALNKPDTLRALQIYFNPVLDDVSDKTFKIGVWTGVGGPQGDPLYLSDSLYSPTYFPGFYNGYYTYVLDQPILLSDTVYIGIVQSETDLLNVGLDRNLNANKNMFFSLNFGASWATSNLKGAWMMRPLFGKVVGNPTGIEQPTASETSFKLFPNPADNILNIYNEAGKNMSNYRLRVFDSVGRLLISEEYLPSQLDINSLKPGFYMFHISAKAGSYSHTYKIVVR